MPKMSKVIKEEVGDVKNILSRIKRRDFSGNEGQAVKNSAYQLTTLIASKIGSIIFTIILARLLLPELFGLYGLALSTILLFASFADLGIGSTILAFISKHIGDKDQKKTKAYFSKIFSMKILLIALSSLALLISAGFIANSYYAKPIALALIMGVFYILFSQFSYFFESLFQAVNDFRPVFIKEVIFQLIRLILLPVIILYFLYLDSSWFIAVVLLSISFSYLVPFIYLFVMSRKKLSFLKEQGGTLSKKENKEIRSFLIPLSTVALSGILFGYVDMILLGHYVASEFLGFYNAALNLAGSLFAIIAFSSAALFPIFGRLKGKQLERGFRKSRRMVLLISILAGIIIYFTASWAIKLIYGAEYGPAIGILKIFSFLWISFPLIALYQSYYVSQGDTKSFSKIIIFSTILNIILSFILITSFLKYGGYYSILGAALAAGISKLVFLVLLVIFRKKHA